MMALVVTDVAADRADTFLNVAAALLAVTVGVYAFVPLIIELALQRSADADQGVRQAREADRAFDVLLLAVASLGASTCAGIAVMYEHRAWVYTMQTALLVVGMLTLLAGVLDLGRVLRKVRRQTG